MRALVSVIFAGAILSGCGAAGPSADSGRYDAVLVRHDPGGDVTTHVRDSVLAYPNPALYFYDGASNYLQLTLPGPLTVGTIPVGPTVGRAQAWAATFTTDTGSIVLSAVSPGEVRGVVTLHRPGAWDFRATFRAVTRP